MSAIDEAIQRAKQRGGPPEPPKPTAAQERQLGAMLDRNIARQWYLVTNPGGGEREVGFNPPQTLEEVRKRYPGCGVRPA